MGPSLPLTSPSLFFLQACDPPWTPKEVQELHDCIRLYGAGGDIAEWAHLATHIGTHSGEDIHNFYIHSLQNGDILDDRYLMSLDSPACPIYTPGHKEGSPANPKESSLTAAKRAKVTIKTSNRPSVTIKTLNRPKIIINCKYNDYLAAKPSAATVALGDMQVDR